LKFFDIASYIMKLDDKPCNTLGIFTDIWNYFVFGTLYVALQKDLVTTFSLHS